MLTDDEAAWALNLATLGASDGLGPLLADLTPPQALMLSEAAWTARGLTAERAARIVQNLGTIDMAQQRRLADRYHVRLLGWTHPDFPPRFLDIPHPAPAIAVLGRLPPPDSRALAIVGARRATGYGKEVAALFARTLARSGWLIASGMADGIDSSAHLGALEGGGQTVAVLGCGLDRCYPASLEWLRDRIAGQGCVLSQYALGCRPYPFHFPYRNRLISALADALLVVEGTMASGSLHTVDWALMQGREVFAVPGSIFSENSRLPHFLLGHGATAATSPEALCEALGGAAPEVPPPVEPPSEDEARLLAVLDRPCTAEEVCDRTSVPIGKVLARLLSLEIKGWVERQGRNRYARRG